LEITRIVLVEDNVDHASLIIEELEIESDKEEIVFIKDGQKAIDYFQKINTNSDDGIPPQVDLVLLDLNLPKVPGIEILRFLKNDSKLCVIPVIILSTSYDPETISEAYEEGANGFITKPISYGDFAEKMKSIRKYWLGVNTLPS
jgi:two-component system response regulator